MWKVHSLFKGEYLFAALNATSPTRSPDDRAHQADVDEPEVASTTCSQDREAFGGGEASHMIPEVGPLFPRSTPGVIRAWTQYAGAYDRYRKRTDSIPRKSEKGGGRKIFLDN